MKESIYIHTHTHTHLSCTTSDPQTEKSQRERGDERKRSEKSGTAAQQMEENDTLGYFYIHISKGHRDAENLFTLNNMSFGL